MLNFGLSQVMAIRHKDSAGDTGHLDEKRLPRREPSDYIALQNNQLYTV